MFAGGRLVLKQHQFHVLGGVAAASLPHLTPELSVEMSYFSRGH